MSASKSQVLITGVYRTGSEYVAQLVGCHPALAVSMYAVNALRFVYHRFDPIHEAVQYRAALRSIAGRLRARYRLELPEDAVVQRLEAAQEVTYGLLYDAVMCALYLRPPAEHWAEKNQLLWREIPLFIASMPNGRAILVVRDPRSVLVSFRRYTYAPPPAYLGAVFNCYDAMKFARDNRALVASGRLHVLRYEDVARDPQRAAESVWRFLGLEGSFDVHDRRKWRDAYGRQWHANSSFHPSGDTSSFDVDKAISRWKGEIGDGELALTEVVCGALMQEFGYPLSGNPTRRQAAIEAIGGDPTIARYFAHWERTGEGIEEFPTDPLDPTNWRDE
jgi:hypothetical protein